MPDDRTAPLPRHVAKAGGWRSSRLRELGYSSYRDYLRSDHWTQMRTRYWADPATPKECVCGEADRRRIQLHHLTYLRIGRERLTDLRPLCRQCHNDVHVLAARNLVRFDMKDYDDLRRRIVYALERRRQLERDGVPENQIRDRPFDEFDWRMAAEYRHAQAKAELGGEGERRRAARRVAAFRRA